MKSFLLKWSKHRFLPLLLAFALLQGSAFWRGSAAISTRLTSAFAGRQRQRCLRGSWLTPGSHQTLLGIKSLLTMKISSLLHCQGGERRALSDPEMSLNFPAAFLRAVITVVSRLCWHNRDKPDSQPASAAGEFRFARCRYQFAGLCWVLAKQRQTCLWKRGLSQNQQAPMDEFVQIGVMDATTDLGGKGFFLKFASDVLNEPPESECFHLGEIKFKCFNSSKNINQWVASSWELWD